MGRLDWFGRVRKDEWQARGMRRGTGRGEGFARDGIRRNQGVAGRWPFAKMDEAIPHLAFRCGWAMAMSISARSVLSCRKMQVNVFDKSI